MASEGSVYIDVNMDVSRAEKNLAKYIKEIEKARDKIVELDVAEKQAEETRQQNAKKEHKIVKPAVYKKEWDKQAKKWNKTLISEAQYADVNVYRPEDQKALEKIQEQRQEAERLAERMDTLRNAYERWVQTQKDFKPIEEIMEARPEKERGEAFDWEKAETEELPKAKSQLQEMMENVASALKENAPVVLRGMAEGFALIGDALVDGIHKGIELAVPLIQGLAKTAGKIVAGIGKGIFSVLTSPFRMVGTLLDRIGTRLRRMFMNVFLFNVISKALREASTFLSGMIAQNTELQNSVAQIKGAIYSIVYPLAQLILPILGRIASFVASLLASIGRFVSMLTGKTWAQSVAGAKAVAGSMKSAGSSAQKMQRTLAGFDEINQLQDNDSGGGSGTIAPSFDFSNLEPIDFGKLFSGLKDALDGLFVKLTEIDWYKLGKELYKKFKKVLQSVDWNGLVDSVFRLLGGLVGAVVSFLAGFFSDIWIQLKAWFDQRVAEMGGNVVLGFLNAIVTALGNIVLWIYNHIFKPFIDGFKAVFKISSPSKVMEEMGTYIIDGLKEGLSGVWEKVKGIFTGLVTKISEVFSGVWDTISGEASGAWKKITNTYAKAKETFASIGTNIKDAFSNAWSKVKSTAQSTWDKIKEIFGNVKSFFKSTFETAWEGVKKVFSYDNLKSVAETIGDKIKGWINNLIDGLNAFISVPFGKIRDIFNKMRDVSVLGIKPFTWLPYINVPSIPKLAQGGVIPPNKEFLAMLGDNKTEEEIVSPLSTLKEAMVEALAESGFGGDRVIQINVDGRKLFEVVVNENNSRVLRTGTSPLMV